MNGHIGCFTSLTPDTITTCTDTTQLTDTGMDTADPDHCDADSLVGGGTDWVVIRGNVVPGETITLRLSIRDTGDGFTDSLVLLDNFQWSFDTITPGMTRN